MTAHKNGKAIETFVPAEKNDINVDIASIKKQLADLKVQIEWEKNAEIRKKLQRKLVRLERLDKVTDLKDEQTYGDINKILKWKDSENIKNSDLLTLRKKWVDIANLTLINNKDPDSEIKSSEMKDGDSFTVNFGENSSLRERTGAGDILPANIRRVQINGVDCERRSIPRPWYYDTKWKYQAIYDGYLINIVSMWEKTREDDDANEKQWKRERLEDMVHNNDKPLTDIAEDTALAKDVQAYKERAVNMSRNFWKWFDTIKATSFRISDAEFLTLANNIGFPIQKINLLKKIMGAIGQHESTSNYGALGPMLPGWEHQWTAAIGRYQIMPKNWVTWSDAYFGDQYEATPENQDRLAFTQMGKYYLKYTATFWDNEESIFREIAASWYGRGSPQIAGHPDTWGYQWSVLAIFRRLNTQQEDTLA